MKTFLTLATFLILSSAFALGPIPDGQYSGVVNCLTNEGDSFADQVSIRFNDTQMHWNSIGDSGPVNHTHTLILGEHGFFNLLDNGEGYFTPNGLHYETSIHGVSGEDTLFFDGKKISLISSVTLSSMKIKCSGELGKL